MCLASISSAKQVGVKVFVNSSPGATCLQKLFLPCRTPKASQHGRKKAKPKSLRSPNLVTRSFLLKIYINNILLSGHR